MISANSGHVEKGKKRCKCDVFENLEGSNECVTPVNENETTRESG
jgi:hypothetical protein